MDELQQARERREKKSVRNSTNRAPDIEMSVWLHPDESTTRQIAGTEKMAMTSAAREEQAIDVLLGSLVDLAQDIADEETYETSWHSEPVFLVYATRKGMRYVMPHRFYKTETATRAGRWKSAIYMLGRTWLMLGWGMRLTWVCLRGLR